MRSVLITINELNARKLFGRILMPLFAAPGLGSGPEVIITSDRPGLYQNICNKWILRRPAHKMITGPVCKLYFGAIGSMDCLLSSRSGRQFTPESMKISIMERMAFNPGFDCHTGRVVFSPRDAISLPMYHGSI
jgi:hypothetical protein